MKKIIIIDDESAGRTLIEQYLTDYPDLILVGEANNGVDAIKIINEFKPDLIFLDVQMPGLTGFEVLPHLEEIPQIIFSTAYDQYALKAFEVHAVDYLLKPYTKERFDKAIQRIKDQPETTPQSLVENLVMEKQDYPQRILVQSGRKLVTVAVEDLIWISAEGDYSNLVTTDGNFLSNYGISKLEEKLNPTQFMRVHRSSIIQIASIESVHKYSSSYDVKMKNGDVVRVSRGYMDKMKALMY
ncbi:MAG: LytTR family DNA-binding domain-containing protein [Bacteroidota bacterium]